MSDKPTFQEMAEFLIKQREELGWDYPGTYEAYGRFVKVSQAHRGRVTFSCWRYDRSIVLEAPTPDQKLKRWWRR